MAGVDSCRSELACGNGFGVIHFGFGAFEDYFVLGFPLLV